MKSHYIIPIFVPFAGCPNQCVFCNQNKISGSEGIPNGLEVKRTIDSYLKTIPKRENIVIEVAYYGGSFTALPFEIQKDLLSPALNTKLDGLIQKIRLSTRSDYIHKDILDLLKLYQVDIIELGVQSLNDEVLKLSKRGHSSLKVREAINKIKEANFSIGIQLMMGLPGDTKEYFSETINNVIELKPDFVRLYPTLVIAGTELAQLYNQGMFKPLSLQDAIDLGKLALIKFNEHNIPVIRIGLQPTDEINSDKILAGPFHPAFRELVESDLMKDKIHEIIKEQLNNLDEKYKDFIINREDITIEIGISPKDHSIVRGQKNCNIYFLNNEFPDITFVIKNIEILKRGHVTVNLISN